MQEPAFFGSEGTRRIYHQIWDWIEAAKAPPVHHDPGLSAVEDVSLHFGVPMRETAGAFGRPAIDWLSRSHLADARREWLLPASCSSKMAMIFLKSLDFGNFPARRRQVGASYRKCRFSAAAF